MLITNLEPHVRPFRADANLQAFQDPVRDDLDAAEVSIRAFFVSHVPLVQGVAEHLLAVTGKRYRPTLLLLVSRLGSPDPAAAAFGAAMIELVHTATLVHDDTIDRSSMRRGRPTINSLYDDKVSTIAGDYICTKVFHELMERGLHSIVRIVAATAYRMSVGEMLQLGQKNDPDLLEESYMLLVNEKTASLMGAACEIGAVLGGLDEESTARFRLFGESLGRAYQIADDLFDYVSSEGEMGKGVRSDLAEGKITLPLRGAMLAAGGGRRDRLRELIGVRALSSTEWGELDGILAETGALEYCREAAGAHADEALSRLGSIPASRCRQALERAVAYAVRRSH